LKTLANHWREKKNTAKALRGENRAAKDLRKIPKALKGGQKGGKSSGLAEKRKGHTGGG